MVGCERGRLGLLRARLRRPRDNRPYRAKGFGRRGLIGRRGLRPYRFGKRSAGLRPDSLKGRTLIG